MIANGNSCLYTCSEIVFTKELELCFLPIKELPLLISIYFDCVNERDTAITPGNLYWRTKCHLHFVNGLL